MVKFCYIKRSAVPLNKKYSGESIKKYNIGIQGSTRLLQNIILSSIVE